MEHAAARAPGPLLRPREGARSLSAADDVLRLERSLAEAWAARDLAAIASALDDALVYWSFSGERRGKHDLLRTVESAPAAGSSVEDEDVRVHGETAVYTARVTDTYKDGSVARTAVTDVFVRRADGWRMIASHETLIKEPE